MCREGPPPTNEIEELQNKMSSQLSISNNKYKSKRSPRTSPTRKKKSSSPNRKKYYHNTNWNTQMPPMRHFVAMDCEMVGIGQDGKKSSPACVTIVNWEGKVLLHAYLRQTEPVTDYRTHVSGITAQHVENAKLTIEQCRTMVLEILYNCVLVGHALTNDLEALNITHPWWLIRDTAAYEPFMKKRGHDNTRLWPRKLKDLVRTKLGRHIQTEGIPHSSYEDACAALDLYRTVRPQWEARLVETTRRFVEHQLRYEQQMYFSTQSPQPNHNNSMQREQFHHHHLVQDQQMFLLQQQQQQQQQQKLIHRQELQQQTCA